MLKGTRVDRVPVAASRYIVQMTSDDQMKGLVVGYCYLRNPWSHLVKRKECCDFCYFAAFRDESTVLTMLAAVKPRTIAIMPIRISLATNTADGDISMKCLTFHVVKATACLTATSERSIAQRSSCHWI